MILFPHFLTNEYVKVNLYKEHMPANQKGKRKKSDEFELDDS